MKKFTCSYIDIILVGLILTIIALFGVRHFVPTHNYVPKASDAFVEKLKKSTTEEEFRGVFAHVSQEQKTALLAEVDGGIRVEKDSRELMAQSIVRRLIDGTASEADWHLAYKSFLLDQPPVK